MKGKKAQKSASYGYGVFMMLIVVCIGVILFLASQVLLFATPPIQQVPTDVLQMRQSSTSYGDYDFKPVTIGSKTYTMYIADTEEKRAQGLSGVEHMNSTDGLAFIFDVPYNYAFWMKDMNFPLDFIYVDQGKVVDLIENVLPESYPDTIQPSVPASIVIELNAGQIHENGVKVGDPIELK